MTGLSDSFSRPINYLRISVTDRCNLRCRYCLPENDIPLLPRSDILSFEELITIAKIAAKLGITKIRLTGGEPLIRKDLPKLIEMLAGIDTIDDLSLTTNGVLLSHYATELKQAGLNRVNVSLDSLKPDKFHYITRHDKLKDVLKGIDAARTANLEPTKINVVILKGINDDEIADFARLTITDGWHVRFIELMPFSEPKVIVSQAKQSHFMPASQIKERFLNLGEPEPCLPPPGNGPARYFRLPGARGTIGFITPVSEHFCIRCNRLRLTADGKLRACLLSDEETNLLQPLRNGASYQQIEKLIQQAVYAKPHCHHLPEGVTVAKRVMSQVGG